MARNPCPVISVLVSYPMRLSECRIHGRVAHGFLRVAPREYMAPLPSQCVQVTQNRHRLRWKGHEMFRIGLGHQVAPFAFLEVEVLPFRPAKFTRSHQEHGRQRTAHCTENVPLKPSIALSSSATATGSVMEGKCSCFSGRKAPRRSRHGSPRMRPVATP